MSGAAALLVAVLVVAAAVRLGIGVLHDPGSGFVLFWAGVLLAACSAILLLRGLSATAGPAERPEPRTRGERRTAALAMAALIAYGWALPRLGYRVSTFLLMAVLFGMGGITPWKILLYSLIAALLSHGLFVHLLKTPLPGGVWGL